MVRRRDASLGSRDARWSRPPTGFLLGNKVELIAEYLRSPAHGDWRWEDDGSAVIWSDGSTVAFRAEISALLELLEPDGLPPFGAIVMILAALRGKLPRECLDPIAPAAGD